MDILNQCRIYPLSHFYKPCKIDWFVEPKKEVKEELNDNNDQFSNLNHKTIRNNNISVVNSNNNDHIHVNLKTLLDNNYTEFVMNHVLQSIEFAAQTDYDDFKEQNTNSSQDSLNMDENKHIVVFIIDIGSSWNQVCGKKTIIQKSTSKDGQGNGVTIIRQRFETSIMGELAQLLNFLTGTVLKISKFQQYLKNSFDIPAYYQLGAVLIDNLSYFNISPYSMLPLTTIQTFFNSGTISNTNHRDRDASDIENYESIYMLKKLLVDVRDLYGALTITISFENKHF